jgi:hypothetical protein
VFVWREDDGGSCSQALPLAPAPLYARPRRRSISCGTELWRQESIHPRQRATAGRWWAGDGAAAGRRQVRVGAAAGRLQTRGHCASTPLRLAIARRPAGLKRGRWRESALVGGGTHPCAATLAPAGELARPPPRPSRAPLRIAPPGRLKPRRVVFFYLR